MGGEKGQGGAAPASQSAEKQRKSIIRIPSYQEVFDGSLPTPPPSFFRPSSSSSSSSSSAASFSEAFSFIKSSEFYTPPPPATTNPPRQVEIPASASATSSSAAASGSKSAYPNAQSRNAILVSHRQKGNPLLKHIRNVRWTFADVVCDYLLGQNSCALYLSLRYHLLHPDYLYYRIRELQKNYRLRVVLCHVDVEDVVKPLLEVTKTALLHDCTLLCGWSLEECGRYLETIKVYENKSADIIKERMDNDYMSRLNYALTSVRHVNKNDVVTLGSAFGSLSNVMDASMEDLARCPGIGDRKVKRLYDTFHEPFKRVVASRLTAISETAMPEKMDEETGKEESDGPKEAEKLPTVTVKSALSTAFAKYSEKVQKKDKETLNVNSSGKADGHSIDQRAPN